VLEALLVALLAAAAPLPSGFDHFYNLEFAEALANFEAEAAAHPGDPDYQNYVAQAILYSEMNRVGALESELVSGNNPFLRRPKLETAPETDRKFRKAIDRAMELAQARLARLPNDTHAMYALGVAYGLRANYNYLLTKAWVSALRDTTTGRKLHNRVTELDPSNYDARLMQGLHEYVVGSLPFMYRALGFLAGFHGDRERGITILQSVAAKGTRNKVDAEILLCALYRRERDPKRALPLIADLIRRFPRNHLLRFEQVQMFSDAGDKAAALRVLGQMADFKRHRASGWDRVPWERIYFTRGTLEFWYRDYSEALENLGKVTSRIEEVDLNTGVLAWLRTGQIHDLRGERRDALECYGKAIQLAPKADGAREARRYLSSPYERRSTAR
jgi:tetratricopeptide (TPR) repeat protein